MCVNQGWTIQYHLVYFVLNDLLSCDVEEKGSEMNVV